MPHQPKKWLFKPNPSEESLKAFQNELKLSRVAASVLVQRGIFNTESAKAWFCPDKSQLHDPFLFKGMDLAVARIESALARQEKIMIYGDYDVDGTTSVALVFGFLSQQYTKLDFYMPDRYKEGYGLGNTGIDYAIETGCSLLIALDCGIKSTAQVEYAKSKGLDIIICDHHLPGESIPNAIAVLDAKQNDCPYPYKELAACGVGFKLMVALCRHLGWNEEPLYSFLDLVVCSIASDIVPLTGENRVLASLGLEVMNNNPRPGLRALAEKAGMKPKADGKFNMTISNLVFGLGPRINAAGRLAHANDAVVLMLQTDLDEARVQAEKVHNTNTERQVLDKNITDEAIFILENDPFYKNARSSVIKSPNWHKGVIGIVASRCIEQYYRPTIVLTEADGKLMGSARSVAGFDLYKALENCADLLLQWGGHTHAAGLSLSADNFLEFRARFEAQVPLQLSAEEQIPTLLADLEIHPDEITLKMVQLLERLAPFGPQNLQPLFVSHNLIDAGSSVLEKNGQQHLKIKCKAADGQYILEGIAFGIGELLPLIKEAPFSLIYHLDLNDWNGKTFIKCMVKDIHYKGLSFSNPYTGLSLTNTYRESGIVVHNR